MKSAGLRWPFAFLLMPVSSVSLFYSGEFFTPNLPPEGLLPREPLEGHLQLGPHGEDVSVQCGPTVSALLAAVMWSVISWLCIYVH